MKFDTIEVSGFDGALSGMRNPLKSYHKADSSWTLDQRGLDEIFSIGENDYQLAKRLCLSGAEHRKWMQMIQVWVDITAPRYWWSECDTYRVGIVKNSESTMHTLKKDIIDKNVVEFEWGFDPDYDIYMTDILSILQEIQSKMSQSKETSEHYHRMMKAFLPEGFLQKRTVNMNYETLANMYKQRKNHRLPEWSVDFVQWIKSLPYSEFITGKFDS